MATLKRQREDGNESEHAWPLDYAALAHDVVTALRSAEAARARAAFDVKKYLHSGDDRHMVPLGLLGSPFQ